MRKSQKKQIENMLEVLGKAQDAIRKALETKNNEIVLSLLEQCQDSAIQIGGMIEEFFGEGFVTVGLLESYCEQIYQIYDRIQQMQPVNVNKIYKSLRKELIRIENSVKNDIQVRTTAVFLPYKASMWDSLESVWKEADEDPNCDAYVVPIPYFDKNPDGSFREMHYEGYDYPNYVPITSWEEYDIAAEHPDMIFIHNPYDEFNHVTSVHPAYYSRLLKNQTDLLIYIPYFILSEIDPNNKEAVENIEHFCTVPAVVYADRIIVQSKEWQKVYIDVMTKTMGSDTRQVWENKILGLGSPKLDKVHTTGRDNLDIPKEWLGIIEKSDGSWKRIIFYNTSVSALLQHGEKMLQKMQYVFDVFKENRDEVALLWRPHPLIKATIESMRPQLWIEYEEIVKTYIEEGWGIYDDTADMNRAVALSDAYYGDPSSIVQIYEQTGKPIMMQNVECLSQQNSGGIEQLEGRILEKGKLNLHCRSCIRVNNKIYFSEAFFNGLFEIDMSDFSVKFICRFSGKYKSSILLHGRYTVLYQDAICFFSTDGGDIHKYNFVTREEKRIIIPVSENQEFNILGVAQIGNEAWIFPKKASMGVYVLNMRDEDVRRDTGFSEIFIKYGGFCGWTESEKRGKWYTYCVSDSVLIEIDIEKKKISEYKIPIIESSICSVVSHNEVFYFIDSISGDLYEWEWQGGSVKTYEANSTERILTEGPPYADCCFVDNDIYMIPYANKYVAKVDRDSKTIKKAFDYPQNIQYLKKWRADYEPGIMAIFEVVDDIIWFYPYGCNFMIFYNTTTKLAEGRKLVADLDKVFPYENLLYEDSQRTLQYFCYSFARNIGDGMEPEISVGERIFREINV